MLSRQFLKEIHLIDGLWDKELHIAFKCLLAHASISQLRDIEAHLQYVYGRLLNNYFDRIEDDET